MTQLGSSIASGIVWFDRSIAGAAQDDFQFPNSFRRSSALHFRFAEQRADWLFRPNGGEGMIAKRLDMREASKSRATRLAEYVMSEMDRAGRVADAFTVNCLSNDPLLAAKEMEICQAKNTRTQGDKTYHLLLSFPDGERPDGERLREIAAAAAKALGYGEHQQIAVVHDDTDNLHIHLVINKIHPQRDSDQGKQSGKGLFQGKTGKASESVCRWQHHAIRCAALVGRQGCSRTAFTPAPDLLPRSLPTIP